MSVAQIPPNGKRLDSWKEIANYLKRTPRTVQRWEKERGLPVHRIPGKLEARAGVYALPVEIDAWLRTTSAPQEPPAGLRKRTLPVAVAAGLLLAIATVLLLTLVSDPQPRLTNPIAITNDGILKEDFVVNDRYLFYVSGDGESRAIKRLPLVGNPLPDTIYTAPWLKLTSVSPNGSEFLISGSNDMRGRYSFGILSASGMFRKLAGERVGAVWSPDGKTMAYASENQISLADRDGSRPRRLATVPGFAAGISWSPDGQWLRFLVSTGGGISSERLWELNLAKPRPTAVLPGWSRKKEDYEYYGHWTPNGNYFIFEAVHEGSRGLWVLHQGPFLARLIRSGPRPLTMAAESIGHPVPSLDGKKIFAVVDSVPRAELLRIDFKIKQFVTWPGRPGISARQVAFSPDGTEVAYVGYPKANLWIMKPDGTGRRQLTSGNSEGFMPAWSPDGRQIAYMGSNGRQEEPTRIRVISPDGGPFREPVAGPGWQGIPTWTPDGQSIVYGDNGLHFPVHLPSASL